MPDAESGQLHDPPHARPRGRRRDPTIMLGDIQPIGQQEHRIHPVQRGCQVAVAQIGHNPLDPDSEHRVWVASEYPDPARMAGMERGDNFRPDRAGGPGDQDHQRWPSARCRSAPSVSVSSSSSTARHQAASASSRRFVWAKVNDSRAEM
jgi:hypothetical protein